jgi:hypothetical protein
VGSLSKYMRRRAEGLCGKCGKVESDTACCPRCRAIIDANHKKWLQKAAAEGLCLRCCKPSDGQVHCPDCRRDLKIRNANRALERARKVAADERSEIERMPARAV